MDKFVGTVSFQTENEEKFFGERFLASSKKLERIQGKKYFSLRLMY
jgi:hypothetical protein